MVVWLPTPIVTIAGPSSSGASLIVAALAARPSRCRARKCGSPTPPTERRFSPGSSCSPTRSSSSRAPRSPTARRSCALPSARRCAHTRRNGRGGSRCPLRRCFPTCARRHAPTPPAGRSFASSAGRPAAMASLPTRGRSCALNARPLGRDTAALQPGDLLYFHQPGQSQPDHLMVFVGRSFFDREPQRLGRVSHRAHRRAARAKFARCGCAICCNIRRRDGGRWRRIRTSSASSAWRRYELSACAAPPWSSCLLVGSARADGGSAAPGRGRRGAIDAGFYAVEQRGVHDTRQPVVQPDLPAPHAARLPRLQRARPVHVLRRAARPASARQRRTTGATGEQLDRTARRLEGAAAPRRSGPSSATR